MKPRHIKSVSILALLAATCLAHPPTALAQLKSATTATTVTTAPNGVPVVNIANPNSAGLSHNQFLDYNVGANGLVLNNGDSSQLERQSQLAGAVSANQNLTHSASVILNEVVSTNRSTLSGYTEVLGANADVVVANPNGITCSGCGFINTSHVTMTTGNPIINAGGALTGFNVGQGDILITGQGLDASRPDYLALFARSLAIQGQINAKQLDIVAGANTIDYATKAVTAQAAIGPAPTLAIDSSALGGMYANRIRLVATEAGVGVRMLGDAAAGTGDFTLTSSGKVQIGSHVSAAGKIQVTSTDNSVADSIKLTDATLGSGSDTTLTATSGNIHLVGGLLASQGSLTLQSATLTDSFDINALANNNQRYAIGNLTLIQTGAVTLDGTSFGTGGALGITASTLSIGAAGETLFGNTLSVTTTGNMTLAGAELKSVGNLSLTSSAGQITTTSGAAQGIESTTGNINLSAGNGVNNGGAISADLGNLTINADNSITNSGTMYAKLVGTLSDKSSIPGSVYTTENIDNYGTLLADGGLSLSGYMVTNYSGGGIQGTTGSTFGFYTLDNYGTIIGSANSANSATLTGVTLTNEATGVLQSAKNLNLNLTINLTNSGDVLATGNLTVANPGFLSLQVNNNSGGVMQAGGTLSITQNGSVTIGTQSGYLIGDAINLNIPFLFNDGIIQGGSGASTVTVQSTLQNNAGGVLNLSTASGGTGTINAADLTNSGTVQSTGNLTVNISNTLTNNINKVIQSLGNLTLNIANTLTNNYYILAGGNLSVNASNSGSTLAIANSNVMQAGGTFSILGTSGGNNVTIGGSGSLQSGKMLGNALNFNVSALTNDGIIQGGNGASTITATTLVNNSGKLLNLATSSGGSGTLTTSTLTNSSTIQSSGNLTVTANSTLTNNTNSIIQAANNLTLNAGTTLTNDHYLLAGGSLTIAAASSSTLTIVNNSGDVIQAGTGALTINNNGSGGLYPTLNTQNGYLIGNSYVLNLASLINGGTIQGNSTNANNSIVVTGTLTNNAGALINSLASGGFTDDISATTVTNNGTIQSKSNMTINVSNTLTNSSTGILQSEFSDVILNVGQILNNSKVIYAYGNVSITAADNVNTLAVTNNATGTIESNSFSINVNGYSGGNNVTFNNVAGGIVFGNLGFNVSSLTNGGTIQGAGFNSITATTLTNSGFLSLSNTNFGSGWITSNGLTNNGTLQSDGSLTLDLGTSTLTEGAGNKIIAGGNLNIIAGTISFGSSSSAIISNKTQSGTGTITLSGKLNNFGTIFSGGNLDITATQIANNTTGGIAALGTLNLTSTLGDVAVNCGTTFFGSVVNCGSLYAGSALNVYAKPDPPGSTYIYYRGSFFNLTGGTVNSSGDIYINTGTGLTAAFDNYSLISASGTITINLGSLQNTTTSGTFFNRAAGNITAGTKVRIENFHDADNYGRINAPTVELASGIFGRNNLITFTNQSGGIILAGNLISTSGTHCPFENVNFAAGENCTGGGFTLTNNGTQSSSNTGTTVTTSSNGSNLSGNTAGTTGTQAGSASGTSNTLTGSTSTTSNTLAGNTPTTSGAPTITLNGVTITLPTNPNGFFIINPNPGFGPLIETNPLYQVGSSFLGADYMIETYGVDPDSLARQLGDANYQAYLIQQQIAAANADIILGAGIENQAAAMQLLMDNGVIVGKSLGLTIGVAPTAAQIANLSTDIVWIVETVVEGQRVLAPVVYLSAATKSQIIDGGYIAATNVNMQLNSVNNRGTILVSNNMNVTTHDNFSNNSGTITAANINLVSTHGDIINQTTAQTIGDVGNQTTLIGKTATITATGNLSLNAANNITNLGANMTAGGNANLLAGNNITFGTIQDITSTTTTSHSSGIFSNSDTTTVNTTVRNIGSNLTVGGNLTANSGWDTTVQGSNINVTGNGSMTTGGSLNILDAQDLSSSSSRTTSSGLGVGGGLYGVQKVTDTDVTGTSVASNVNFGGNGTLTSTGDFTLQGSNAGANGNLSINAAAVNVLAGQNTSIHTRTVDTTTLFSLSGSNSTSGGSETNTDYKPMQHQTNMGQAGTGAGANASASETDKGVGINFVNNTITTTIDSSTTAVGSSLHSGGDLTVKSTIGDTTLVGANVSAGGAADLNAAGNLNILAAQNTHTVTTTTSSNSVGLYSSSENSATAGANASYGNTATGGANKNGANELAGSSGNYTGAAATGADASSKNTLNLVDIDRFSTTTTDITHTGTTITSGGNTTLGATNDINIAGSKVNAGDDLTLDAGIDLNVIAVTDSHTVTTSDSHTTAGLYADGEAKTAATGSGVDGSKYGGVDTQANGKASANTNVGIGLQGSNTTSSSTSGSTTAIISSLTSGGDMTRTATGTITDQGTQINAGGSFTQTAESWVNNAAEDTTFSTTGSETNTARLGLYAGADASKSGSYDQNKTLVGQDPSASAGVSANYKRDRSGSSSSTSTAVVSNIKAGSFTSTTTGATSLEGTDITTTAGDLTLNASSLDYTAAQDTTSSSNSSDQIDVGLKVGKGTGGYTGALSGGANELGTSSSSSTAVVGGLNSAGNLTVKTSGDQTYEGTNLTAANSATVQSDNGNITFDAAQNTTSSSTNYQGFTGDISGNQKGGSATFNGGTNSQGSSSSTAVVSNVTAGSGGLTVKAENGTLTMQGTNLATTPGSGGDITLGANILDFQAAQNTSSSYQNTQTLDAAVGGSKSGGSSSGSGAGSYINNSTSNSSTNAVTGSINADGKLTVTTAGSQTYTGTDITAGKDATITSTGGAVNFNQAQNTSSSSSTQWGVSASGSSSGSGSDKKSEGAIGGGYQTNSQATTTGIAGNITTGGALNVTSNNDLTLQGTNITSGGDTTLQSNNGSVDFQALTSTATGDGWGFNAQLNGSKGSDGAGSKTIGGQAGGNYSTQNDVTQTAGSINSSGAVTVKGNQDVTLVGTNVTSTGATTLTATNGNVNIDATTSTQDDQSYALALSGKKTTSSSGTSKNNYGGGIDVNVNETSTQTGATINAGSLNITSGKDTNMTGTNVQTSGDTSLNAAGNLNLAAAQSTYGGVDLNASYIQSSKIPLTSKETGGIPIVQSAGVKGGSNSQGVNLDVGGNLSTNSGGTTTMQATQADVDGTSTINASGGLKQTTTTSGGVDVGFSLGTNSTGTSDLDMPEKGTTQINAKGGNTVTNTPPLSAQQAQTISAGLTSAVPSAPPALQSSLTSILNNPSLSTADKFKQMGDAIKNDPTLSSDDKAAMLAALAKQQQNLSGQ